MSEFIAARADILFQTNSGVAIRETGELGEIYNRTTGAMSTEALRLAAATDRLNNAIARSGPESTAAKNATLNYRRELEALGREQRVVAREGVGVGGRGGHLRQEERAAGRFARGGVSGLSRDLGSRAFAFGSTAFLGGIGLEYGVGAVVKAAEQHQAAEAQLEHAVKNAGLSFDEQRGKIDQNLRSLRALSGFTEEDTTAAFTRLLRSTGDVGKALHDTSVAADIARGANISLDQASSLVNKALAGQTTGLRRLGVELPKGIKGYQAIQIAAEKYAGSAAAFGNTAAGAQARLHNAIHQTEVTIGQALLPTITRLESRGASWLSQSKNQARIQHDVARGVKVAGEAVHGFEDAVHLVTPPLRLLVGLLGGTRHTVELLALAFAAMKLKAFAADLGLVGVRTREAGAAAAVSAGEYEAMGAAEGGAASGGVGGGVRGAERTAGRGSRVAGRLGGVAKSIGPQLIAVDAALFIQDELAHHTKGHVRGPGGVPMEIFEQNGRYYARVGTGRAVVTKEISQADAARLLGYKGDPSGQGADWWGTSHTGTTTTRADVPDAPGAPGTTTKVRPPALDRLTRINLAVQAAQLAQARGDKGGEAAYLKALKDEIDYDRDYEKKQERLMVTDVKHRAEHAAILQRLQADEQSALGSVQSIEDARAQKAKQAHDKAARAAEKHRREEKQAREKEQREREKHHADLIAIRYQKLKNDRARAKLTVDDLADDRQALQRELAFDIAREHDPHLTGRQHQTWVAREIAVRKALQDLGAQDANRGGYAGVAQAAADTFLSSGSNIASSLGGVLSTQDERARTAESLLKEIRDSLKRNEGHGAKTAGATTTLVKKARTAADDIRDASMGGY